MIKVVETKIDLTNRKRKNTESTSKNKIKNMAAVVFKR